MSNAILSLTDVSRVMGRGATARAVLQNLNLAIARHSTLGIRGSSGAGKTTLARILAGLDRSFSGTRYLDPQVHHNGVQLVVQDSLQAFNPRLPVGISLLEGRLAAPDGSWLNIFNNAMRIDILAMMEVVALDAELLRRPPGQLSGGQRQRMAIGRALLARPRVLVLDEPVAALDLSVQARVLNVLSRLKEDGELTMVVISHDEGVLDHLCDQIVYLREGRICV
jgi:ABC-type dipeptide/oligopeptide/nickel transport system ATPase subunit